MAALVKEGKLPPLTERLPIQSDVMVHPPNDEIGIYGGIRSNTGSFIWGIPQAGCIEIDADSRSDPPGLCKSWKVSEDGRTYTYGPRQGATPHFVHIGQEMQ